MPVTHWIPKKDQPETQALLTRLVCEKCRSQLQFERKVQLHERYRPHAGVSDSTGEVVGLPLEPWQDAVTTRWELKCRRGCKHGVRLSQRERDLLLDHLPGGAL